MPDLRFVSKVAFRKVLSPAVMLTKHAALYRYVRPATLVRTCDDCNFGTYGGRCIICGSQGTSRICYSALGLAAD